VAESGLEQFRVCVDSDEQSSVGMSHVVEPAWSPTDALTAGIQKR
jgi:hypothetical protein